MVKTRLIEDRTLGRNQVKIHAVGYTGVGYTSVFEVFRGKPRELRNTRRASNAEHFWPMAVCRAMLSAACRHLLAKRS